MTVSEEARCKRSISYVVPPHVEGGLFIGGPLQTLYGEHRPSMGPTAEGRRVFEYF
jgi:hypothetical protein